MERVTSKKGSATKAILIMMALFIQALLSPPLFAEKLVVIHPMPESPSDTRWNYHWEILEAALSTTKNEGPYEIKQSSSLMVERRLLKELTNGDEINIIRDNAAQEIEEIVLPIRIPLLKGILGHRVFLIKKSNQKEFSKIKTFEEFKQSIVVGAGQGWATVEVLQANGVTVTQAAVYEGLFLMLMHGRFDAFPRGINEAPKELKLRANTLPDMTIEENLMLRYPFYEYFFVNNKDTAMAARIERGLNNIIINGMMDKIFDKYFGAIISSLDIDNRLVFDLKNPSIKTTPSLDRKELWFEHYMQKKRDGELY